VQLHLVGYLQPRIAMCGTTNKKLFICSLQDLPPCGAVAASNTKDPLMFLECGDKINEELEMYYVSHNSM
jgi:hypothetical protein